MQTFLPYPDVVASVACLDRQRLGKQRLEVLQLLTPNSSSRANHPACVMWRGHNHELALYGIACCDEWIRRGYKDTTRLAIALQLMFHEPRGMPSWFGGAIHANHRARLLQKAPEHYSQFGWSEQPTEVNYWPTKSQGH